MSALGVVDPHPGEPFALACIARDTREKRRSEHEARRRQEFEQQLIGIVSHDLRNPLSAISLTAATLLRRQDLGERTRTAASRILTSAERANRMIRDLLDFTRARLGGGLPIVPAVQDLAELIESTADEVRLSAPGREIAVACTGPGLAVVDADRIAQALGNLLANAILYSPPQSPIHVRCESTDGWIHVEVHNEGPAIPAAQQRTLFEPMKHRGQRAGKSLGLGLFIVEHIARAHGGSVELRSVEGEGTTFTLRIPREPAIPSRAP